MVSARGGFVVDPPGRLVLGGRRYDLSGRALVMGILNRSPDSFYQRHPEIDDALRRAEQMAAEGAEILDVGGVKAGPGAAVTVAEEIERVVPMVAAIRARVDIHVSVDTYRAPVAAAALDAGAVLVNDISGLSDPALLDAAAERDASLVITHMQGEPRVPHLEPQYGDLMAEVTDFLRARLARAGSAGVTADRVVVDPGLDLGKSYPHSLVLVREMSDLAAVGAVVLLSASHKAFLGAIAPLRVDERHEATMACVAYGFARGARVFRVHAVDATVRVVQTMEGLMRARADDPWVSRYEPDGYGAAPRSEPDHG